MIQISQPFTNNYANSMKTVCHKNWCALRVDSHKPTFKQVGNKHHAQEASESDVEVEKKGADQSKPKFCF